MHPTFFSTLVASPRIVREYASSEIYSKLPWALAALGVGSAGVVVAYFFIKLAEWLTGAVSNDLRALSVCGVVWRF